MKRPTPSQILVARKKAGHTQQEAAISVYAGSYRTWQDWERGRRKMPIAAWVLYKNNLEGEIMTEQEQIEIWRKEFFTLINEKLSYQNYPESDLIEFYLNGEIIASHNHPAEIDPCHSCEDIKEILWHSFLMAKQSIFCDEESAFKQQ